MKPLTHREIFGNWGTLLLPINEDDSIDYDRLAQEIDLLIAAGVNGIYSNGTAGEFYNQTEAEFDRISELLAMRCNAAGTPFQIGCCHMSPKISLERVKRAVSLKPSAIQVILPDWSLPSMTEVIRFLEVMAEAATPVGLVLYNPPHAKKKLTPDEFLQIKNAGIDLVGCKVPGGDDTWYARMRALVPDLSLFIPGHTLASGLSRGAHGAYSNVACLHPKVAQWWYEIMHTDMERAVELEARIQLFMNKFIVPFIHQKGYSNQAVDKLLAAIGGWAPIGTRLRWPYQSIDSAEVTAIKPECEAILPEFFQDHLIH